MLITDYSPEAGEELLAIHDGSFPFPNISNPSYIIKKVAIEDGEIVGAGIVKLTSEFILILDKSKSKRVRVNAASMMQKALVEKLAKMGIPDVHIFVNDPTVSKFAKHMGFEKCPEIESLSLRIIE